MTPPFAIVAGDIVPHGGMDRPNYELAWHQADRLGAEVHLVSHRVAPELATHPNVVWHRVPRPLGRHAAGAPLLRRWGCRVASRVAQAGGNVVVNGGNCPWGDVNWIHYVHNTAGSGRIGGSPLWRQWSRWRRRLDQHQERQAVAAARVVITDSNLARDHLIAGTGVDPAQVRTIYYGVDPAAFRPPTADEREAARRELGLPPDRPVVAFVGVLTPDRRKGFDVLFDAWRWCASRADWDALLLVAGAGAEVPYWHRRVAEVGLGGAIRLLGFTEKVPTLLAAADALVSPTRFEPYGQGIHEALCCGLPAFVTRCAGIAERYPDDLRDLLLDDPPDAGELADRLQAWRKNNESYRQRTARFAEILRRRTWSDMATEIVDLIANHRCRRGAGR